MRYHKVRPVLSLLTLASCIVSGAFWCGCRRGDTNNQTQRHAEAAQPTPTNIPVSDGFDYPVGRAARVTEAKDGDGWYNAQDLGENNHLGEDWNGEEGGNSDCGLPVYAASKGLIFFAGEAGPGWGKVIILRHRLPDGTLVETLYAHLQSFARTSGEVDRREKIASVGDADRAYPCHLHFELRFSDCPAWGSTGPGYSHNRTGWADPSDYIDAHRLLSS
jgi:murein DD-endopeptidase MepM/ murein hydrolase activator NlpD